jgi:copper homeostasis protein (lipoprotein)
MMTRILAAVLCCFSILVGCAAQKQVGVQDSGSTDRIAVTYAGALPCADCEGQLVVLTLFPDSSFRMRTTYLGIDSGRNGDFYDLGCWSYIEDTPGRYLLQGSSNRTLQFSKQPDGALRQLDLAGQAIVSTLNYELKRQQGVDTIAGPMKLRGMYVYQADAASLSECQTGRRLPVLIEGNHLALERAYLAARRKPGEEMLVSLSGRFVERAPEPGLPLREHLIVEAFERVWLGETCASTLPVARRYPAAR